jgi:poly-beta-1,6-N-acetyl-D-glucosamine biosynthesis protein PgaD
MKLPTKTRPLVISHPELLSPLRRLFAFAFTLAAWGIWVLLMLPVLWIGAARLDVHLPRLDYFAHIDTAKLDQLLDFLPLALLVVLSWLSVQLLYGVIVRVLRAKDKPPVSAATSRVATNASGDPAEFSAWQSARIVQVEHAAHGRIQNVHVVMAGDGTRGQPRV